MRNAKPSLLIFVLFTGGVSSLFALTPERPARVVRAGEPVRLQVQEVPAGARVWFELPERGPSGRFVDNSRRTAIDASAGGIAEAWFTAGDAAGPFLADATVSLTGESVSFAVTVLGADEPQPPIGADEARATAEQDVKPGDALHGPVLARAGVEVHTPVPPVVFNHNAPFALARDAWLAWIDTEPGARFGHGTRWIVIDAEDGSTRTLNQDWWPELRTPGQDEAAPLLSASRANRQRPGSIELPGPIPPAPADTCMAAAVGDRSPEAAQDIVELLRFQALAGRVWPENARYGRTAGQVRSALETAAQNGCRRLTLLLSGHAGQARGGGMLMEPEEGGAYLTYAQLAEWLAPFSEVEVLFAASFAAGAADWFDGRGFAGVVLPMAAEQGAAPADAVERLLSRASADRSLAHAHDELAQSGVFPPLRAIEPGGPRRMWQPDVDLHDAGGVQRIDVSRPRNLDLGPTLIYNASADDPGVAGIQTKVFVLPSDQDFLRFAFGGVRRGTTRYELTMNDSAQQIYTARGRIDVGSFTAAPEGAVLRTDRAGADRLMVTLRRHGHWQRRGAPTVFRISSRDESVAAPVERVVETEGAEAVFELAAASKGVTSVDIWDETAGKAASLEVHVLGAPDMACPERGSAAVTFTVAPGGDPGGTAGRMALAQGMLYWRREGSRITLWGDRAQMVTARGTVNADCGFSAAGDSGQELVSGSRAVEGAYANGRIAGGQIRFDYRLGPLQDGPTVTYTAAGAAAPHDGVLGAGALLAKQSGGETSLAVGAVEGTGWTASPDSEWIRILGGETGEGPGVVRLLVTPNGSAERRIGTVAAAGEILTIVQAAGPDLAEPLVTGVVNGATFQEGVAPGTWLTITGFGLANETRAWFSGDNPPPGAPLPTELAGVSVTINGRPAYVQFVSPRQVNVLAPDDPTLGRAEVVVRNAGRESAPVWTSAQERAPELFRFQPREGRYPAAVHPDGTLAGPRDLFRTVAARPVSPGDVVLLFGSGFGATDPPTPTGFLVSEARPLAEPVVARIGGEPAEALFGGIVGAGLYQLNVRVPELPPGDHRVEIWIGGRALETTAYLRLEGLE